ncbi:hypothetical protein ACILE8_10055 [Capnocytophaga canimorsus]|uniref:hypothetical protein n=1 Tax=Capnocytophaga canimorsus TaxID=28188 RepID=UPI0037D2F3A2
MIRKIYQTLEDRNNPDEVESQGPFPCNRKDAWLGSGYYFWDSSIDNAHWWGKEGACYKNYFICESSFHLNEKCLDLYDNPEHRSLFKGIKKELKKQGLYNEKNNTVRRIIEFLKNNKLFPYEAVRAEGKLSKKRESEFSNIISFNWNKPQYLDLDPAVQICFVEKDTSNRKNFKIVYPPEYCEDYVV